MIELLDSLLPDKNQQAELEIFLNWYFGGATRSEPNTILYGNILFADYNKLGKLKSIRVPDNYKERKDLILKAKEALRSTDEVQFCIAYSHMINQVKGFYRYRDLFQILPPHPNAPVANQMYADHPFRIEYKISKSSHLHINNHRNEKQRRELTLLFNSLFIYGIKFRQRSASNEWVIVTRDDKHASEFLQVDYWPNEEAQAKASDGFTDTSQYTPIKQIDYQAYYQISGIAFDDGNQFILPNNFENSLNHFYSLSNTNKEKFLRAAYWQQAAFKIAPYSLSAAFNSMITSIEVFLPQVTSRCKKCGKPVDKEECSECHQPITGPTKLFREFVERYATGIPEKERKELYQIRSTITHGASLLPTDEGTITFNTARLKSEKHWRSLLDIVKVTHINWLYSPN